MSMESKKDPAEEEKFSFLQEKIKEEPFMSKKILKWFLRVAVFGLIFGIMACMGFYIVKPWAGKAFLKKENYVKIPTDEEEHPADGNEEKTEPSELTVEDYSDIYQSLHQVVKEAEKSIVQVYGINGTEEWINDTYDTVNSVSGAVIANTGTELFILSNDSIITTSEDIDILFCDGKRYPARLKKRDTNLGIAVFGVEKSSMESSTLSQVKTAKFGNSDRVQEGDVLIALGKPFAYSGGIGYGVAGTVRQSIVIPDGEYSLLLTDIPGNEKGSGFLVDKYGDIVGIIKSDLTDSQSVNSTNALAISNLKTVIELLSNDKSVPYIGIIGTEISEDIHKKEGIPKGIYVKGLDSNSPAMDAGIQNGDVITQIDKMPVKTMHTYQKELLKYEKNSIVKLKGLRRGNNGYVEIEFKVMIGSKE